MCPPVSPYNGASIVSLPAYYACVFGMETPLRGRSGGHTGAAPTVSFGQIVRGRLISFGWIACVVLFVGKTVHMNQHHRCCTFDSPGLPAIGGYPGESRGGEPMPSALYFLKSICMREIIHLPRVVRMCDEKKYNPQGG